MALFADLNHDVITGTLPDKCAVVAICGFPIRTRDNLFYFMGNPIVSARDIEEHLTEALGLGAVLTFKNPKKKSLLELGQLCLKLGHNWTLHTLSLTVLFSYVPVAVRNAFAFDRRFHLSWVHREQDYDTVTFTATGSLKEWKKIGERAADGSFFKSQREAFQESFDVVSQLFPSYFKGSE